MQNETAREVDLQAAIRRPARTVHESILARKAEIDESLGILAEWLAAEAIKNWPDAERPTSRSEWESRGRRPAR